MSFDKINDYSNDDTNIQNLQQTANRLLSGHMKLTLTEMDTTTVPAIAAGSVVEVNNSLYYATTEQAISTVDPVTLSTVADGTVYVCLVPAEDTNGDSYVYAAFTATAPTWSDSKQGYYGTGGQANYRHVAINEKATASYTFKTLLDTYIEESTLRDSRFLAYATSGTISTPQVIVFGSEEYDVGSDYNNSTGIFTAPYDGYYYVSVNVRVGTTNGGTIELNKNSSVYYQNIEDGSVNALHSFSLLLKLEKDDTIDIEAVSDISGLVTANKASNFSIYKINT